MLKLEYEIMYKIAKTKILTLSKLVRLQNDEINKLKAENQRYKEGYERAYLVPDIESKTRQVNLKA